MQSEENEMYLPSLNREGVPSHSFTSRIQPLATDVSDWFDLLAAENIRESFDFCFNFDFLSHPHLPTAAFVANNPSRKDSVCGIPTATAIVQFHSWDITQSYTHIEEEEIAKMSTALTKVEDDQQIIKPEAISPTVNTSDWPLLLKNWDQCKSGP